MNGDIKKRKSFLSMAIPDISEKEVFEVVDTLRSGWISAGPKVKKFEEIVASYHQSKYAVAVSSATAALFLVAKVLGIGKGDFVIVPTITWPSTANIIEQLSATPIFVDANRKTLNTTPEIIEKQIKKYKDRIKMIIPVHMSGLPVDIDSFQELSEKYGIPIVYDAAHAIFSKYKEKRVGSYGLASCFSFYAIKNITTGDGGVITTDDKELYEQLKLWSYHGMNKNAWKRYAKEGGGLHVQAMVPGYKFNMTDLQAALGLAQMQRASELLTKRNELIKLYNKLFEDLNYHGFIDTPIIKTAYGKWGNHVYGIKLNERINRSRLIKLLGEHNIGTNIHFYPVHQNLYYRKKYPEVTLPNAEWLGKHLLSLPLCSKYTETDVRYVVDIVEYLINKFNKDESLRE